MNEVDIDARFPEKLRFLFDPYRYKIAYGGRGSTKSWSFARALLIKGSENQLRILCAREVQKSIEQSVHLLLSDQIRMLELEWFYKITDTEITGINGTQFNFAGLSNITSASLKSYEGVDIVWVEEAQTVTKKSWDTLIPTIRKDDSEIWVSFNPELDTDETYVRFVVNPPPNSHVCFINYDDVPTFFPRVLEDERRHCEIVNKEDYPTIWQGKCRSAVVGAIYAKDVELAVREHRITNVPYNPMLKVHCIWDLGWNDSMFIILAQKMRSEISIIETIEDSHKTLDWYVAELETKRYNWGYDFIPHDGMHKDYKTGKSTEELLKAFGRKPRAIPNVGIEDGIKTARMSFRQMVFDRVKAARLVECLKRYKRIISRNGEPGSPLHDQYSHGADDFRYLALVADQMTNEDEYQNYGGLETDFRPTVAGSGM